MYALNKVTMVAHIKPTMEICNFDQVKHPDVSAILPIGYRLCGHCKKR